MALRFRLSGRGAALVSREIQLAVIGYPEYLAQRRRRARTGQGFDMVCLLLVSTIGQSASPVATFDMA